MRLTIPAALDMIASHHDGVTRHLLKSPIRTKPVAHARQEAMVVFMDAYEMSLTQVGHILSRDHTTVLHGCRAANKRAAKCPDTAARINAMCEASGTPKFTSSRPDGVVFKSRRAAQ